MINDFADLKPYLAMKPSGVEWLGEVPEHWELRRTKTLLRERSEKGFPDEPLLAATQTKGVVRKEQYENRTVLALKDLHLLKLVRVSDFVISLRSFQGGIEYAREQGIISPAYTILLLGEYADLLLRTAPYKSEYIRRSTGIRSSRLRMYRKSSFVSSCCVRHRKSSVASSTSSAKSRQTHGVLLTSRTANSLFSANIAPASSPKWLPASSMCGRRPPGCRTRSRNRSRSTRPMPSPRARKSPATTSTPPPRRPRCDDRHQ